jgi:hypothetical protein
MATTEENKDPYADIRNLLYRQKPETREAEIRAEKNRAKATAFLQAFGTIADAFTLSRGGDVPKRDASPYIMNNMQKADAYREQDRADKKAWENSWLNLQNNIAQYNIRQQDWEKQRAREDEMLERQQEHQVKMTDKQQDFEKFMESVRNTRERDKIIQAADIQAARDEANREHERYINDTGNETKVTIANIGANSRENVANIRAQDSAATAYLKSQSLDPNFKTFMQIPNPQNPTELIPISKSLADKIFAEALHSTIEGVAPRFKESGSYTDNDIRLHGQWLAKNNPDWVWSVIGTVLGAGYSSGGRQGGNTQSAPVNPWQTQWQRQQPMPQGMGPLDPGVPAQGEKKVTDWK